MGKLQRQYVPLLVVFVVAAVAVVFIAADRWRRGAFILGVAAAVAAILRLVLSTDAAGVLAVRSKPFDVAAMTITATAIIWLALSIDPLGSG